jgi:hypothetical protein
VVVFAHHVNIALLALKGNLPGPCRRVTRLRAGGRP